MKKYKTFWPRFWAGIVDLVVVAFCSSIIFFIFPDDQDSLLYQKNIAYLFPTLYFTFCHYKFGQTVGKHLNGIAVIHVSEKKLLDLGQAMSREFAGWLELLTILSSYFFTVFPLLTILAVWLYHMWYPLEILTMLSNRKRRALHDFIARSVVVRVEAVPLTEIKRTTRFQAF
ncbi:RDD family protein [Fibrobacterota bacterium]